MGTSKQEPRSSTLCSFSYFASPGAPFAIHRFSSAAKSPSLVGLKQKEIFEVPIDLQVPPSVQVIMSTMSLLRPSMICVTASLSSVSPSAPADASASASVASASSGFAAASSSAAASGSGASAASGASGASSAAPAGASSSTSSMPTTSRLPRPPLRSGSTTCRRNVNFAESAPVFLMVSSRLEDSPKRTEPKSTTGCASASCGVIVRIVFLVVHRRGKSMRPVLARMGKVETISWLTFGMNQSVMYLVTPADMRPGGTN
mmetsp:Transcript_114047/g.271515  ORF Transcript_114047/g.271515 Transcript_114047/m.271515 type:complete len:260 (+) Transcript_114047:2524-3303(+)